MARAADLVPGGAARAVSAGAAAADRAPGTLAVGIGQCSDKGLKPVNQDCHGAVLPEPPERAMKGVALAIADGISSSEVSQVAAETAVKSFLLDYYATPESWSVKTAASRVIRAANSWLYAQTRRSANRYERDKGYVCTFSALVLKSATAHIFHVGDARIYRLSGTSLEQLTTDHRVVVSAEQSYLGRALGADSDIEIDYQAVPLSEGDIFLLATDGVYEHVAPAIVVSVIATGADDLDKAARRIVDTALENGSSDNLTLQIVRIDRLPTAEAIEVLEQSAELPPAPPLEPPTTFEGYRVLRALRRSSRSHVYLAEDQATGAQVVLKVPSVDLRGEADYLRRFMMEEWVARRINDAHVLKAAPLAGRRGYLYSVMEHIDGQTLAQWMADRPQPDLETVRGIAEQIARGLRAFHRKEMLHQDVRPENIMIDRAGTVRIIDFGSVRIAGLMEASPEGGHGDMMGTAAYTAPEYLVGEGGTELSDLYGLGVMTYQMLTGQLPYGARMAQARTRAQQGRVRYTPAFVHNRDVPAWMDAAIAKAVHPDPARRQAALSEFTHDLSHPRAGLGDGRTVPLIERDPVRFWQLVSAALLVIAVVLAAWR